MFNLLFDGQQTEEIILYEIKPHPIHQTLSVFKAVITGIFFMLLIYQMTSILPAAAIQIRIIGILLILVAISSWVVWIIFSQARSSCFVTDRRIIRFEPATPFFTNKRSLFWNEVLKTKIYYPNFLYRILKIGTLVIEPHLSENENIKINYAAYAEDLANYIDKILFLVKNRPGEIASLKQFVAKPKGKRN
jgi:hypothetical protein